MFKKSWHGIAIAIDKTTDDEYRNANRVEISFLVTPEDAVTAVPEIEQRPRRTVETSLKGFLVDGIVRRRRHGIVRIDANHVAVHVCHAMDIVNVLAV